MLKIIGKAFKWVAIVLGALIIIGFLYVWFIFLAPPKEVSSAVEINDFELHTVVLGGPTMCSDGSPFSIYTRKGKSDNLIIHFSGGGACWDSLTCGSPTTLMSIFEGESRVLKSYYLPKVFTAIPKLITGLLNGEVQSNPFKDWSLVYIPYCTGDLHIGNVTNTYRLNGKKFEIHHNGRNNSLTALEWVFDNFKKPGKILVSGESAGAYASVFWAPAVAQQYEHNKIYQLSDASLIESKRWVEILDSVWKAESSTYLNFTIGRDIYEDALLQRKDSLNYRIKHLHSNTIYDNVLTRFSAALNHTPTNTNAFIDNWSTQMRASMKRLDDSGLDYQYFLSDCQYNSSKHSTPHTLAGINYYKCDSESISFPNWLKKNIIEDEPLSVGCKLLVESKR